MDTQIMQNSRKNDEFSNLCHNKLIFEMGMVKLRNKIEMLFYYLTVLNKHIKNQQEKSKVLFCIQTKVLRKTYGISYINGTIM